MEDVFEIREAGVVAIEYVETLNSFMVYVEDEDNWLGQYQLITIEQAEQLCDFLKKKIEELKKSKPVVS